MCNYFSSGWLVGMLVNATAAATAGATGKWCLPVWHMLGRVGPGSSSKGWGRCSGGHALGRLLGLLLGLLLLLLPLHSNGWRAGQGPPPQLLLLRRCLGPKGRLGCLSGHCCRLVLTCSLGGQPALPLLLLGQQSAKQSAQPAEQAVTTRLSLLSLLCPLSWCWALLRDGTLLHCLPSG